MTDIFTNLADAEAASRALLAASLALCAVSIAVSAFALAYVTRTLREWWSWKAGGSDKP